jgi:hypothetical protein
MRAFDDAAIQEVLKGYQAAAEWSSLYRDDLEHAPDEDLPEFIDSVTNAGWSPEAEAASLVDIRLFCEANSADLEWLDYSQIGHDLWLSRNHHGSSFRDRVKGAPGDRVKGAPGDRLTRAAQGLGEVSLWINKDKKVCLE